ncbi:hypothetical protein F2P58_09325 [Vibrio fortis]|uniref:Uncharacterized protein n=1 Tax=Vibrio fortis TaxID=212667 RepID=A0A5N3R608_9VIBR|nr:hypothetical protein [Vibrio fortis]KAB0289271.1 hypothetical protein F2P58_09325 [Vibrio fortis]
MTTSNIPQFILDALAKQNPVYVLNDCNRLKHGNKTYHFGEEVLYDYSIDKTSSELGDTAAASNKEFLQLKKNMKLVTIRRHPDRTLDAVEFIYEYEKQYLCPDHGPIGEIFGHVTNITHYRSQEDCRKDFPEMFNKNGGFKRHNIIKLNPK